MREGCEGSYDKLSTEPECQRWGGLCGDSPGHQLQLGISMTCWEALGRFE